MKLFLSRYCPPTVLAASLILSGCEELAKINREAVKSCVDACVAQGVRVGSYTDDTCHCSDEPLARCTPQLSNVAPETTKEETTCESLLAWYEHSKHDKQAVAGIQTFFGRALKSCQDEVVNP